MKIVSFVMYNETISLIETGLEILKSSRYKLVTNWQNKNYIANNRRYYRTDICILGVMAVGKTGTLQKAIEFCKGNFKANLSNELNLMVAYKLPGGLIYLDYLGATIEYLYENEIMTVQEIIEWLKEKGKKNVNARISG